MSEIAILTPERTVQLPPEIARHFLPSDRFLVWLEGDTLLLKRLAPSPLKRVENAPDEEPLSLDAIDEIVHAVRRRHKQRTK
jgi:hypothetical protein